MMEINFTTHEGVQVVSVQGALGQPEGAAIRNKLEEKINQGRTKVLFDLSLYDLKDNTARDLIVSIIVYAVNRGVLTACCEPDPKRWPQLILPNAPTQSKIFLSREEALQYLTKAIAPKAHSSTDASEPVKPKSEKEAFAFIKTQELENLLQKYSIYQKNDQDDPFRLEFFAEQYKKEPSAEVLVAEKRASEFLIKGQDEIKVLDEQCNSLAKQVKQATLYRKIPAGEKELDLKEQTLKKSIDELTNQVSTMSASIETHNQTVQKLKAESEAFKSKSENEFNDLQDTAAKLTVKTDEFLKSLKEKDESEQKEFDEKKKKLVKAKPV